MSQHNSMARKPSLQRRVLFAVAGEPKVCRGMCVLLVAGEPNFRENYLYAAVLARSSEEGRMGRKRKASDGPLQPDKDRASDRLDKHIIPLEPNPLCQMLMSGFALGKLFASQFDSMRQIETCMSVCLVYIVLDL